MGKEVSIIIPSYGKNTNLRRAVDSVLAQDYEDIQVIVVDDNGKGSEQQLKNQLLMDEYRTDARVRYIVHDTNRGGSAARNTGVKNSDGEYVGFLDDDDEFCSSKISTQMRAGRDLDATWAGTYSSAKIFRGTQYVRTVVARQSGDVAKKYLSGKMRMGTPSVILRRSVFEAVGGFDESFIRHQDWEFFSRVLDQYKILAVENAFFNRCYKTDGKRYSATERLSLMDHYVEKMKLSIQSIPAKALNRILRRRYIGIVCSLIKEKDFKTARQVMKREHFGIIEYFMLLGAAFQYGWKRLRYGKYF